MGSQFHGVPEGLSRHRGLAGYAIIDKGSRIPDLTRHLHYQLWTIDEGRVVLGKAGQRRDISLIDRMVSTPEHIDFVAGPKLERISEAYPSLERCAPPPCFIGPEKAPLRTKGLGKVPSYQDWKRSYEPLNGPGRHLSRSLGSSPEKPRRLWTSRSLPCGKRLNMAYWTWTSL